MDKIILLLLLSGISVIFGIMPLSVDADRYVGEIVCADAGDGGTVCGAHDEGCQCSHMIVGPTLDLPGNTTLIIKSTDMNSLAEEYKKQLVLPQGNVSTEDVGLMLNSSKQSALPINSTVLLNEIDLQKEK